MPATIEPITADVVDQQALLPRPDLGILSRDINAAHHAYRQALSTSMEHALTAGRLLLSAKASVPHGAWVSWVTSNCEFSHRTATVYMRITKAFASTDTSNKQRAAYLGESMRELLEKLVAPERQEQRRVTQAKRRNSLGPPQVEMFDWLFRGVWVVLPAEEQPPSNEILDQYQRLQVVEQDIAALDKEYMKRMYAFRHEQAALVSFLYKAKFGGI